MWVFSWKKVTKRAHFVVFKKVAKQIRILLILYQKKNLVIFLKNKNIFQVLLKVFG
jgi:hypothetical protein